MLRVRTYRNKCALKDEVRLACWLTWTDLRRGQTDSREPTRQNLGRIVLGKRPRPLTRKAVEARNAKNQRSRLKQRNKGQTNQVDDVNAADFSEGDDEHEEDHSRASPGGASGDYAA
eukprot:8935544-Pyramimonas_sp.AAC.1